MTNATDRQTERGRRRNPRGQGDRLRDDLLESAAELMAEHGTIDKVSVRAVAAGAGVTPTAVYRHFEDHATLLHDAVQYCFDEFQDALLGAIEGVDDPSERLRVAGHAYVRFATEHAGKYRVMFSNRIELPPREVPPGTTSFDHLVGWVADILDARGDGRDPFFVAVHVHTWMHGIVDLCGRHPNMPWPDIDQLLDELMVRLGLV